MKSFHLDLAELLSVAAAVLDWNGVLLQANAGFLRLLPEGIDHAIGTKPSNTPSGPSSTGCRSIPWSL